MKRSSHTRILLISCISAIGLLSPALSQQGDRKGHNMTAPIAATKIPPSPYLSLDDALEKFQIAPGYVIEPVASGKDVYMSVALSFDGNGRAWSCEMRSYMPDLDGNGEGTPNGRIRVLEDTNGDGKTDRVTTFLEGLVLPRAVAVTSDGCLYTSGQTLYFTKRDGLKPVGKPTIVDAKYSTGGNPEHSANALLYGHDNWYYNAKSTARYRRINGKWIKDTTRLRGQWGLSKDNAGRLYYNTNSVTLKGDIFPPMFMRGNTHYKPKVKVSPSIGSRDTSPIHITPGVNRAYLKGTLDNQGRLNKVTAACGVTIYRGDNFPEEQQGMAFICEPAGDLIKAVKISRDQYNNPTGSHPYGSSKEFLASSDEWFLPCNLYTAPDGSLWLVDMYFGLLQHKAYMTSYLRHQYTSRKLDRPEPNTGRIYRIRYQKNKLSPVPQLEGLSTAETVNFLSHPNGTIRDIAQRRIVESQDSSVTDALTQLIDTSPNSLAKIHALWTLEGLGEIPTAALVKGLKSSDPDVINNTLDIIARSRMNHSDIKQAITSLANKPQTLHARIKASSAAGMLDQALELTLQSKKTPFVSEVFISSLGSETVAVREKYKKINHPKLDSLLTTAAKAAKNSKLVKTKPGAHLNTEDLTSFKRGKAIYTTKAACFGCHGTDGAGLDSLGPPLDKSEWVTKNPERLTKILLQGMVGPLSVNGVKYSPALAMPGLKDNASITDQDLADVINYISNAWSNQSKLITPNFVKKIRSNTKSQQAPYQAKALE